MFLQYLRAFVIGSSFLVFFPFFLAVYNFNAKDINYTFSEYAFVAPFSTGVMNMSSLFISNAFELSRRFSIFIVSLVAPILVLAFVKINKLYNYKSASVWFSHIWKMTLMYLIVWNVVVYNIDKYI